MAETPKQRKSAKSRKKKYNTAKTDRTRNNQDTLHGRDEQEQRAASSKQQTANSDRHVPERRKEQMGN
jgi:hypothetical protein